MTLLQEVANYLRDVVTEDTLRTDQDCREVAETILGMVAEAIQK